MQNKILKEMFERTIHDKLTKSQFIWSWTSNDYDEFQFETPEEVNEALGNAKWVRVEELEMSDDVANVTIEIDGMNGFHTVEFDANDWYEVNDDIEIIVNGWDN